MRRPVPRRHLRDPGPPDAGGDPARGAPRGHAHRPRIRGEVDGGAHRPGRERRDREEFDRAVRPPGRPAGAERLQRTLPVTVDLAHREEGAMEPEREFMGRKKAKLWTYL